MDFNRQLENYVNMVNCEIKEVFHEVHCPQRTVYDAMNYSILAGGKRLRPVLCLAVCDMLGGNISDALRVGIAIEQIHTYSLIHDDLPCMDNDDLRRGMPTCHKKFGEANALLAGDGLLTSAFEHLANVKEYKSMTLEQILEVIFEISKSAGCDGMIGGQIVDLECEGRCDVTEEILTYLHERKTGALIRVSALSGAIVANASDDEKKLICEFAENLGLAFQIQDDILDCEGDESVLGKPIGSDAENEKTTYVTLLGLEEAKEKAHQLTANAIETIEKFGEKAGFIKKLARHLLDRNY